MGNLKAVVVAPCPFDLDPRHGYWSATLREAGYEVVELEVLDRPRHWRCSKEMYHDDQRVSVFSEVSSNSDSLIASMVFQLPTQSVIGKYLKSQFLRITSAVEIAKQLLDEADLVVGNDLAGIVATLFVAEGGEQQLIYDAQEVFTDSYDLLYGGGLTESERHAWIRLESAVVRSVHKVVTVSPGIRDLYIKRHNCRPEVIPNFVPERLFAEVDVEVDHRPIRFVFLGRADPHRGLEELVDRWDFDPSRATLDLFIPASSALGTLKKRSLRVPREFSGPNFREAVRPGEIVRVLRNYDLGILPYAYPPPYDNASPNKFGEYVAAGLPVLANRQPFTASLINGLQVGRTFDWRKSREFEDAVEFSLIRENLMQWKTNVLFERTRSLNWNANFKMAVGDFVSSNSGPRAVRATSPVRDLHQKGPLVRSLSSTIRRLMIRYGRHYFERIIPLIGRLIRVRFVGRLISRERHSI